MEKLVNQKIDTYINELKNTILIKLQESNLSTFNPRDFDTLLRSVNEYPKLVLTKEDFVKRKRSKNVISCNERCIAKRANGEQCSRRRKGSENMYCGTHEKGRPHGEIEAININTKKEQIKQVFAQDFKGILYYLDNEGHVYNTEDIVSNKQNPRIIATYEKKNDTYTIPEFNL